MTFNIPEGTTESLNFQLLADESADQPDRAH